MIVRFLRGFRSPFEGFRLVVSNASFWRLATIPFIIDLILFGLGLYFGLGTISSLIPQLIATDAWWGQILNYVFLVLSSVVFVILLVTLIYFLTNLIAAPFNALLAEKTLVHIGALQAKPFAMTRWILVTSHMLVISLIRAAVFVTFAVVMVIVSLIPGLNVIAAFAGLLVMSFDCADFAFEAQEKNLKHRFKTYRERMPEFSGFACALGLTFLIPGLNLLLYPSTVVGAALLVATFDQPKIVSRSP